MYSPCDCFMISKNVFWMKMTSVERFWAQASAYFCTSASSWSRGTTLFTNPHSAISSAVKGRPVKTISWNFRSPIDCAHHHIRGAAPA